MIDLSGKRALVTAGSRGIGAVIVEALAENGADVAFTYQRSIERAAAIGRSVESRGRRAVAIQADSADPQAIAQAVEDAVAGLGGLDILVNSAAIGHTGNISDLNLDDYQTLMDVNVRAPVLFAKAAVPHLRDGGRRELCHPRHTGCRSAALRSLPAADKAALAAKILNQVWEAA